MVELNGIVAVFLFRNLIAAGPADGPMKTRLGHWRVAFRSPGRAPYGALGCVALIGMFSQGGCFL